MPLSFGRSDHGFLRASTAIKSILALAIVLIPLVDVGSVFLAAMRTGSSADDAGIAAVLATHNAPVNSQTAQAAYDAAEAVVSPRGQRVEQGNFFLAGNGAVTLTVTQTAPTILLGHIPGLSNWVHVHESATQQPAD